MKSLLHQLIALVVLLAVPFVAQAGSATAWGDGTGTSWNCPTSGTYYSGSTVALDGVTVMLGSADDSNVTWTWHSGNAGLIPSQMPNTNGTSSTLITSFSTTSPFGTLPTRGCFLKVTASVDGTLTVGCKPSTDAAQQLVFVTMDADDPTVIAAATLNASIWDSSYTYELEAGRTYYIFQLAKSGQLSGYRFTLKSIAYERADAKKIKVFTIGDSTMANKSSNTERGWGMLFPWFVDEGKVTVSNYAADGRSTKSFIDEGRWTTVVNQLAEGDYVLIQFGHNDEKTDASLHTDPQTTYKENLTKFINEARAKGANPVLLTSIVRRIFGSDANIYDEHTEYAEAVRELATELSVPLIDMNLYSRYYENIAGIEGSRALHEYFPGTEIDNTHLCQLGAYITARCVAEQIALNDDIEIALNSTPTALTGAYTSTLEYAQHQYNLQFLEVSSVPSGRADDSQFTSLADIDAAVRAKRHESRTYVVNGDFAEGSCWYNDVQTTRPMGWKLDQNTSGSANIEVKTADGVTYWIVWAPTMNYIDMSQEITDLPNGNYALTALVKASRGNASGSTALYANNGTTTVKVTAEGDDTWHELTLPCTVANGQLVIGLRSESQWYARLAEVKLTAVGSGPVSGEPIAIVTEATDGAFAIATAVGAAPIYYDAEHDHTVVGIVAEAVAGDIETITGKRPEVNGQWAMNNEQCIIAGTIGQSTLIDGLIAGGQLDVSDITGRWEMFKLQTIGNQLIIAGSTPRGTAYGLFELSRLMGVSPWTWWADVVPEPRTALYATAGTTTSTEPSVKYRGFFINDEDWGMKPWAAKNMDTDIQDIGPRTYERVFELLLRLRGNYMWPAMHECTKAFWYYAENPVLAKKYAVVLGSSHAEPMLRNNVFEWFNEGGGWDNYNFVTNPDGVTNYWRKRVIQSKDQDAVYTVGMRGIHDSGIAGYGGDATRTADGLSQIIATQRQLIRENIGDPTQVPQMFVPYKEVLSAYNTGRIDLPEDITLTWVDDNHGYIRQFPNATEQQRSGSHGIYYHLSYWGSPQDYLWLSTTSPSLISYELSRGYDQGIQRLWVINVGDIKPAEEELEFCMDLAWDINKWNPTEAHRYSRDWAARTFGEDYANEIAEIKQEYYRLGAYGKPEHVCHTSYRRHEREERIAAYKAIADRVEALKGSIPARLQDAYFQLIEYPVRGAYLMNVKHLQATTSFEYAQAGMETEALAAAAEAQSAYDEIQTMTTTYNTGISNGKWNGMMSSKPRGQSAFNMPGVASADDVASVQSALEEEKDVLIAATDYVSASPALKSVEGLGGQTAALATWPMDLTAYSSGSLSSAPSSVYSVPVGKGVNIIKVRCLPTFPLNSNYDLRYAISIDGASATVQSIKTTAQTSAWDVNVLRGWAGGSHSYVSNTAKSVNVRIYFMDPGLVLNDIVCEQPTDNLTDQVLTNADFEYKAAGQLNSGGATVRGVPYGWTTNTTFPGDSYGINNDGANRHGDNLCWFYNKTAPVPDFFQLSQTVSGLDAGTYRVQCRLWAQSGNLGTVRLFANNNVQYYGKQTDYVNNLTAGEVNTFAGYSGTSNADLKDMYVIVTIAEGEDLTLGVRTSNQKSDGSRATSGSDNTGWFKCDYFRIEPYNAVAGIVNPGFGQGTTGWTIDYSGTANVKISSGEKPEGSSTPLIAANQNHLQLWGISATGAIEQTVTNLPNGRYEVGVTYCKSGTLTAKLFANDAETSLTGNNIYKVVADVTNGILRLGVSFSSSAGATLDIDAFTLTKLNDAVTLDETDTEESFNSKLSTLNSLDITLVRSLVGGKWQGFSLPFSLTAEQIAASPIAGIEIAKLKGAEGNTLNFAASTVIEAGKPYFVRPAADVVNPTFEGVEIMDNLTIDDLTIEAGAYTFVSQLYNANLPLDGSVAYLSTATGALKRLTSGGLKGMRSYLKIPAGANVKLNFEGIETGVDELLMTNDKLQMMNAGMYNLAGQRLAQPTKGVNIVNGKKFIVK